MRFVVVLVDASEEDALGFFEQKIITAEPVELLFVDELTETTTFVRTELANKRIVDAVIFVSLNPNLVPLIFQASEELKKDPWTRKVSWMTLVGEQACDVIYMDEPVHPGIPQSLLDILIRKRGAPKQPN